MDMETMFKLTYGLFVLTGQENGRDNGCIINTAGQVTAEPNRIAVTVNKVNDTHDIITKTGRFNLSVISQEADFDLFRRFGFSSGREVDKFAGYGKYAYSDNGIAYITEGTNGYISGSVVKTMDLDTHTLFIADVTDMEVLGDARSATYEYYQEHIKPKPQKKDKTVWVCKVCGYEYEGEELPEDFICPWCKHPASDFEKR